jgi:hypothetical protein
MNIDISNGRVLRGCSTIPPHDKGPDTLYLYDLRSESYFKMVIQEVSAEEALQSNTFETPGTTVVCGVLVSDVLDVRGGDGG